MPIAMLNSIAKKAGVSVKQAEKAWEKAKSIAKEQGHSVDNENFYAVVVGILKNMLKVETIDLLRIGWNPEVLAEAIISKSSASFMKSRIRKISNSIGNIGSGDPVNWKSIALHMRLFFDEYLSALSSRTGIKALLLGESNIREVLISYKEISSVQDENTLLSTYKKIFPDVEDSVLYEIIDEY